MNKLGIHADISFKEDGHTYVRNSDGKLLTGVTTILDTLNKPYLIGWAAKEVYNFLLDKQELIKSLTPEEYEKLLFEAKNSRSKKSDKALDSGKIAHGWIEKHIGGEDFLLTNEEALSAVNAFLKWEKENKPEWLASELIVASTSQDFAGTLDAVAKINGKTYLIDFKTSKQISPEYYLQTAAYQLCLEEMGVKVGGRLILRLPKDGKDAEAQEVPTPYEFDRDTFIHLRQVYRWKLNYENNIK
jgi:CRISPR/Cas system-associated exonuclease Cas4 (RecB family)